MWSNFYRPSKFSEVISNQVNCQILQNIVKQKKFHSSYIFYGSYGSGKSTLARVFSKAINCSNFNKELEPCDICPSCISIQNQSNPDVIEQDAGSSGGVSEIRELISLV